MSPLAAPACCALALTMSAFATELVKWPDFMGQLRPTKTTSPNLAQLPMNLRIVPPEQSVPAAKAAWSGVWSGWACLNAVCDTKLAVQELTADGATIVYDFTNERRKSNPTQIEAAFVGNELHAKSPSGGDIAYRMRIDGHLDFIWKLDAQRWVSGLLVKQQ